MCWPLSVYVTRLVLHTPLTANQVTVSQTVFGLIGSGLVALGEVRPVVWGVIAWQVNCLLDAVDGEVARFRATQSIRGVYLDQLNHLIVNQALFLGSGIYSSRPFPKETARRILTIAVAAGLLSMAPQRIARRDTVWFTVMIEPAPAYDPARLRSAVDVQRDVIDGRQAPQDEGWRRRLYGACAAYPGFMNILSGLVLLDALGVPMRAVFVAYCLGGQVAPRLVDIAT